MFLGCNQVFCICKFQVVKESEGCLKVTPKKFLRTTGSLLSVSSTWFQPFRFCHCSSQYNYECLEESSKFGQAFKNPIFLSTGSSPNHQARTLTMFFTILSVYQCFYLQSRMNFHKQGFRRAWLLQGHNTFDLSSVDEVTTEKRNLFLGLWKDKIDTSIANTGVVQILGQISLL